MIVATRMKFVPFRTRQSRALAHLKSQIAMFPFAPPLSFYHHPDQCCKINSYAYTNGQIIPLNQDNDNNKALICCKFAQRCETFPKSNRCAARSFANLSDNFPNERSFRVSLEVSGKINQRFIFKDASSFSQSRRTHARERRRVCVVCAEDSKKSHRYRYAAVHGAQNC